jgi:hypothetical protein
MYIMSRKFLVHTYIACILKYDWVYITYSTCIIQCNVPVVSRLLCQSKSKESSKQATQHSLVGLYRKSVKGTWMNYCFNVSAVPIQQMSLINLKPFQLPSFLFYVIFLSFFFYYYFFFFKNIFLTYYIIQYMYGLLTE